MIKINGTMRGSSADEQLKLEKERFRAREKRKDDEIANKFHRFRRRGDVQGQMDLIDIGKFLSDTATFNTPDFRSYCMKNYGKFPNKLSRTGLIYYRVFQENYKKWRKDEQQKERDRERESCSKTT